MFPAVRADLLSSLTTMGYFEPTEAQRSLIPALTEHDGDFVGQLANDRGKISAYLVALLTKMDLSQKGVQALILVPNSEIGTKVSEDLDRLTGERPVRKAMIFGGVPLDRQLRILEKGRPHIVIANPEKLVKLYAQGLIQLHHVKNFIVDEALQMEQSGLLEDIEYLIKRLSTPRSLWLFTTHVTPKIEILLKSKFQKLQSELITQTAVKRSRNKKGIEHEHIYSLVEKRHMLHALRRYLLKNPFFRGTIFCDKKSEAMSTYKDLTSRGWSVGILHGDLSSQAKDKAFFQFASGKVPILICSDVATKRIPTDSLAQIVHLGAPQTEEIYLKRLRILNRGISHLILTPRDYLFLKRVEKLTKIKFEAYVLPSNDEAKEFTVKKELTRLDLLKSKMVQKGDNFEVDRTYKHFKSSLVSLSKEEVLKLVFTWTFHKTLREIDSVKILSEKEILNRSKNKVSPPNHLLH